MIRYASCVWELPMPTTFRAYQPDQPLLLPPDLQEWVPPGHLAHHVSDVVDALDLTAFYAPYEGDGRRNAPYEPSMMVKVLIYAYATGTFSSRAVARKLEEDVAFRMLAAGNFPQHRTVCEFRRRHLAEFSELFVGVVQVAREMGLARFGKLSVDGTKVRANASKRSSAPAPRGRPWRADMAVFSFCSRPPGPCWWHGGSRKAARRLSPPHSSSGSESRKKPLNQRADRLADRSHRNGT